MDDTCQQGESKGDVLCVRVRACHCMCVYALGWLWMTIIQSSRLINAWWECRPTKPPLEDMKMGTLVLGSLDREKQQRDWNEMGWVINVFISLCIFGIVLQCQTNKSISQRKWKRAGRKDGVYLCYYYCLSHNQKRVIYAIITEYHSSVVTALIESYAQQTM